jgi:hypothetical protein
VVRGREDQLLVALLDPQSRKVSHSELARRLGWEMKDRKPYHVLVARTLKALTKDKLITIERGRITLTNKVGTRRKCCSTRRAWNRVLFRAEHRLNKAAWRWRALRGKARKRCAVSVTEL